MNTTPAVFYTLDNNRIRIISLKSQPLKILYRKLNTNPLFIEGIFLLFKQLLINTVTGIRTLPLIVWQK